MGLRQAAIFLAVSATFALVGCSTAEDDATSSDSAYSNGDGDPNWNRELQSFIQSKVQRVASLDTGGDIRFASNGSDAVTRSVCISTWMVGGGVFGKAASNTCVVVGLALAETGVGAGFAAVCAGADGSNLDALVGATLGGVGGWIACPGNTVFRSRASDFRVFAVPRTTTTTTTQYCPSGSVLRCDRGQLADFQERKNNACGQQRSCNRGMSCADIAARISAGSECADARDRISEQCCDNDAAHDSERQTVINTLNYCISLHATCQ